MHLGCASMSHGGFSTIHSSSAVSTANIIYCLYLVSGQVRFKLLRPGPDLVIGFPPVCWRTPCRVFSKTASLTSDVDHAP